MLFCGPAGSRSEHKCCSSGKASSTEGKPLLLNVKCLMSPGRVLAEVAAVKMFVLFFESF